MRQLDVRIAGERRSSGVLSLSKGSARRARIETKRLCQARSLLLDGGVLRRGSHVRERPEIRQVLRANACPEPVEGLSVRTSGSPFRALAKAGQPKIGGKPPSPRLLVGGS